MTSIQTIYQYSLQYFNIGELRSSLLLLLLLGSSIGIKAENPPSLKSEIFGQITLGKNEPAIGVVVGVASIQKFTITDANGFYRLNNIPWGDYLLETSTLEAKPKSIPIKLQSTKHKLSFDIERSIIDLEDVTVVGETKGQQLKKKGYAISVVNTKESMFSSLQATDLLDRATGIKLRQSGGTGSEIEYNINGLSGNSIRIFIDGLPIRSYGSSFSLSSIPPSMIERIEVYKGVLPADLTEDALGGGVNIVLKQVANNKLSSSYSYGSLNTHKWDLNGSYHHQKTGFTAGASIFYNSTDNDYNVWGDPIKITDYETGKRTKITARRFHDNYMSAGVNVNLGFTHKSWADRFMLGLLFSELKKDIQHGATMEVVYGNRKSEQNTKMINLRYSKNSILKGLDVATYVSYSNGDRKIIDTIPHMYGWDGKVMTDNNGTPIEWNKGGGEAGDATLASNLEQNISGRFNLAYRLLPEHKISVNYLYDNFKRDIDDPLLHQMEQELLDTRFLSKNIFSTAYENSLFDNKLKTTLFYKYYHQKVELTELNLVHGDYVGTKIDRSTNNQGLGGVVSFQLKDNILFMFSGEKAIRLPSHNELLGNTSNNIESSYDLNPEKSTNLNIGGIFGPFTSGQHSFNIDVNLFYRNVTDMIVKSLTNLTDEMYGYENLDKILSKGIDLDIRYDFSKKIFVELSASNFNARYNLQYNESGNEYLFYKDRLPNAPYLTANGNIKYVKDDLFLKGAQFSANYNLGYVHDFFRDWESLGGAGKAVIPKQMVHDIGLMYTFPKQKFTLSFDLKNAANEQVFDNWALQKPGRMFFTKLSYNIF